MYFSPFRPARMQVSVNDLGRAYGLTHTEAMITVKRDAVIK